MKRYEFRLQSVLRARRTQEDQARQSLALANRRLRDAQVLLAQEQTRYQSVNVSSGVADVSVARSEQSWQHLAAASVAHVARCCEDLAVAAADHQAAWREAAGRVAALERLDDRRRAEHALVTARADSVEVDDLVTARFLPADAVPSREGGGW